MKSPALTKYTVLITFGNYILKCNYLNQALRTKLTNQNIIWEQRIVTFHINGPMTLKFMYTNHSLTTKFETQQCWGGLQTSQETCSLFHCSSKYNMYVRLCCWHSIKSHSQVAQFIGGLWFVFSKMKTKLRKIWTLFFPYHLTETKGKESHELRQELHAQ